MKHPLQVPLPWVLEVTTTSAAPALVAAGVVPVIWVGLTTIRLPSLLPAIVTPVTSMKFAPVIVTLAPPARGPLAGLTAATMSSGGVTGSLQPGVATTARRCRPRS